MATSRYHDTIKEEHDHGNTQPSETALPANSPDPFEDIDDGHTTFDQSNTPEESSGAGQVLAAGDAPAGNSTSLVSGVDLTGDEENIREKEEKLHKILNEVGRRLANLGVEIKEADYAQLSQKAKAWIAAHPYQTAFQVSMCLLTLGPGLLAGPVLGAAGFSSSGVVALSAAAARQAAIGNVAARSTFAVLQSAGAGGYGLPIVHGV
ncbi:MAG: hypothetical protein Q9224_005110, partial [Gallowayella concinna]